MLHYSFIKNNVAKLSQPHRQADVYYIPKLCRLWHQLSPFACTQYFKIRLIEKRNWICLYAKSFELDVLYSLTERFFFFHFAVCCLILSRRKKPRLATWIRRRDIWRYFRHCPEALQGGLKCMVHVISYLHEHSPFLFSKLYVLMSFSDSYCTVKVCSSVNWITQLYTTSIMYHTHSGVLGHDTEYDKLNPWQTELKTLICTQRGQWLHLKLLNSESD